MTDIRGAVMPAGPPAGEVQPIPRYEANLGLVPSAGKVPGLPQAPEMPAQAQMTGFNLALADQELTIGQTLASGFNHAVSTVGTARQLRKLGDPHPVESRIRKAADAIAAPVQNVANEVRDFKDRLKDKARVLGGAALVGVVSVLSISMASGQEADPDTEGAEVEPIAFCDPMFPDGNYEATANATFRGELHTRPAEPMTDVNQVIEYFFGADGVATNSAATLGVLSAGYTDMLGAGGVTDSFGVTDMEEAAARYAANPEIAADACNTLARAFADGEVNTEPIDGAYWQVGATLRAGRVNPNRVPNLHETPVALNAEPGDLFVLDYRDIVNDGSSDDANQDQKLVVDMRTGQIYFLDAFGADILLAQQEDSEDQDRNDGASNRGRNNGGGGGSGNGDGKGPGHNGDTNGCDGTCGTGGGGGGGGGGCGHCGGGGGGGGGIPPTVTTPPPTTTTPPPTTTPPTTTVPPTTTTVPPTTVPPTTVPPVTHDTQPGPNGGSSGGGANGAGQ